MLGGSNYSDAEDIVGRKLVKTLLMAKNVTV